MFNMCRRLLLTGLVLAGPAGAAQVLGGQQLDAIGQTVGAVTQNVRDLTSQTLGTVVKGVSTVLAAPGGNPIAAELIQPLVTPGTSLATVARPVGTITTDPQALLQLRAMRQGALVNQFRAQLDVSESGAPVRRAALLLTDPTDAEVAAAAAAGFPTLDSHQEATLGLTIVTVGTPRGLPVRKALKRLTEAVPGIPADVDPLFEPAGGSLAPVVGAALAGAASPHGAAARIAMIDGGVAAHPSLAGAAIEQKGFAGRAEASGHGTAIASLLVGDQGPFRGAARGSALFVADVYGGNPSAGSASAIVRALSWAAAKHPKVITISLVGPPNMAIERAVAAVLRKGILVVAAVGNDGPAAPPAYPASYDGVLSVTGVDGRGRALAEAGRPRHLDIAAPGAAMAAALPSKGYANVRGTSFAAPLAAARLLFAGSTAALVDEAIPGKGRVGRGIVCSSCRIAPSAVGLK